MLNLHKTLALHKKTVLFSGGGFNVECKLKPNKEHKGFKLNGFSTFTGCTFTRDGQAFFGDSFELTINLDELSKYTEQMPSRDWFVSVKFPQINNKEFEFKIEQAPFDRLIGTILLRCSALNTNYQRLNRNNTGGI